MNVVVCCKFVPDVEDMVQGPDGSVSLDRAKWGISEYDLQAIEAGVRLAEEAGGTCVALSAGPARVNTGALRKDLLSRGPSELTLVADDALDGAGVGLTSAVLAAAVHRIGADVVLCGAGSADLYNQMTGQAIAARLNVPSLDEVNAISVENDKLVVERLLERTVETDAVDIPCVLSVTSGINVPRQPGMRDILAAGKKPVTELTVAELGIEAPSGQPSCSPARAADVPDRKNIVIDEGSLAGSAAQLVDCLKADGIL